MPLTDLAVRNAKPSEKRREIPDGNGVFLVVQPTGAKSYALRYRFDGVPRKYTLGRGDVGLKEIRRLAEVARGKIASGIDPASQKRQKRVEAKKAVADAKREKTDKLSSRIPEFIDNYAKHHTREATWLETQRLLNREVLGAFGGEKLLSDLQRADVAAMLNKIRDRGAPIVANRTLAAFRRLCSWAVAQGHLATSPCAGLGAPAAEVSRDRVLADPELRAIWSAADGEGWPYGPIVQLLILTGQRLSEVGEMRWHELDMARGEWIIPKERAKNHREHVVPLSPQALEVIAGLKRIKGKQQIVFTKDGETFVTGFSRAKREIAAAADAMLRAGLDEDMPPTPRWTFHDLRRTAASGMARLGVNPHVVEAVLNHKSGTIKGVAAVYNRYAYGPEKKAALEEWAAYVDRLVTGDPASFRSAE